MTERDRQPSRWDKKEDLDRVIADFFDELDKEREQEDVVKKVSDAFEQDLKEIMGDDYVPCEAKPQEE